MRRYNPQEIEPKWQKNWEDTRLYEVDIKDASKKFYVIPMFPYPSGDLHIGHWYNFAPTDTVARWRRMQGHRVLQAIGFDSFGLPAENAAIKRNIPPAQWTKDNIAAMTKQLATIGASYDWSKTVTTSDPDYYRWTQWLFLKLFEKGLAYRAKGVVNWCPKDQTVLANEQVVGDDNVCDRCGTPVVQKEMEQWYFKITDYAERLLKDLDEMDWPARVKLMQANWIGKSQGALIDFKLDNPRPEAISYVMGVEDISGELLGAGVKIDGKTASGSFKVSFPYNKISDFEKLITERLKPGFWNEYIADDIVFVFKDKDGSTQRIVWDESDETGLLKLCNEYAKANFPSIREMLEGNDWYSGKLESSIKVFTTRPDTIFGATFMVVAPEHEILNLLSISQEVKDYIAKAERKTELERKKEGEKDKTGVFSGAYAINPANGEKIPIWIADYVLMSYGTGAIMAVPAHDERDWQFAKKYNLPIVPVVIQDFGEPLPNEEYVEGVVVIAYDPQKKKYLALDKWANGVGLAGGGINRGETYEECARRELLEETGIAEVERWIKLGEPVYSHYYNNLKDVNKRSLGQGYLAIVDSSQKLKESGLEAHENFQPAWMDMESIRVGINKLRPSKGTGGVDHWLEMCDRAEQAIKAYENQGEYEQLPNDGEGILINSGQYDGQNTALARENIVADLAKQGIAKEETNYRLRDWLISRQRYWGPPIPVIYCNKCGIQPVPEKDLPVLLPEDVEFTPTGQSPLKLDEKFVNTTCPNCDGLAKRETDTMDTFVDSSWYFLRYPSPDFEQGPYDPQIVKNWGPVDHYIGGIEHAILHLMYARFVTMFLHDHHGLPFEEPFKKLSNQGIILGPDGHKMSKSRGNVISPDEQVTSYGADSLRLYMMFMGPYDQGGPYNLGGITGTRRFLERVWSLVGEFTESKPDPTGAKENVELTSVIHRTIKSVSQDLEVLAFNTAIASLMGLVNELYKTKAQSGISKVEPWKEALEALVLMLAPFAPHISEEMWQDLGHESSVHRAKWPLWDELLIAKETVTLAIQINGKVRAEIEVPADISEAEALEKAKSANKVASYLQGKEIKKAIYVPGRIVSLVTS